MKVTICKRFDFDAAHWLPNVPDGHKCKRLHGHTYRVDVVISGVPDERGFVVDYAEIADAWEPIHDEIDHHCLNDVPGLDNPSTEVLAPWILRRLVANDVIGEMVESVRVYESSTTWCEATARDIRLAPDGGWCGASPTDPCGRVVTPCR